MLAYITGEVITLDGTQIICLVEGTGLGYEIAVSPQILGTIRIGHKITLILHHHITEAGQMLFGFRDIEERKLFRELLKVSGIGGKTALQLLSLGSESLLRAIQLEDDKLLSTVPGIGKKTAQKIIVDLKGSIDLKKVSPPSGSEPPRMHTSANQLLATSLIQMGYDKSRVEGVVETLDPTLSLEIRTVEAIKQLSL